MNFQQFKNISDKFSNTVPMPVLFVGHGSPMNAIQENSFTKEWAKLRYVLPKPNAILCISAHWLSRGTFVTAMEKPKTIHDFYGFPKELEMVQYPATGSPELADLVIENATSTVGKDESEWGLDHGSWSVLKHIYPEADIPVVEVSIDYTKNLQWHYDFAKELSALRSKGVLIVGSGNIVHNLGMINWRMPHEGFDWALEADDLLKNLIQKDNSKAIIDYQKLNAAVQYAIPSPDHYIPMLYSMALRDANENISFFNEQTVMGSISMTSFMLGNDLIA
ncbi:MAG: 4,5-DOPA dioxygenase extradiol [Pseudopedobacter saltans]|uniref:4,5-DOPA dioxygenase extradiol n=1 Tax=Pseudopedobacter saltans TaxID=151895 RepID=A0A2W5EVU3_9SPHI|nr:MAG: 4,5-DOPA dioxygenase extradiol [Pseudopedobacter saltans]